MTSVRDGEKREKIEGVPGDLQIGEYHILNEFILQTLPILILDLI